MSSLVGRRVCSRSNTLLLTRLLKLMQHHGATEGVCGLAVIQFSTCLCHL